MRLVNWWDGAVRGQAGGSFGVVALNEDEDPKLVLRRFGADLLTCIEAGPEWPAAEVMLTVLVNALSKRLFNTAAGAVEGGAAPPAALSRGDKAVAVASMGLLGMLVGRLLKLQGGAARYAITIPPPIPTSSSDSCAIGDGTGGGGRLSKPTLATLACGCGRGLTGGVLTVCCDRCQLWFHTSCVSISEDVPEWWSCDDCKMRSQVSAQKEALESFVEERESGVRVGVVEVATAASPMLGKAPVRGQAATTTPRAGISLKDTSSLFKDAVILRELALNYVTEQAYDNLCARMARRFLIAKWASSALQTKEDLLRCGPLPLFPPCASHCNSHFVSPTLYRDFYISRWTLPHRVESSFVKAPVLSPFNMARLALQVRVCVCVCASVLVLCQGMTVFIQLLSRRLSFFR